MSLGVRRGWIECRAYFAFRCKNASKTLQVGHFFLWGSRRSGARNDAFIVGVRAEKSEYILHRPFNIDPHMRQGVRSKVSCRPEAFSRQLPTCI